MEKTKIIFDLGEFKDPNPERTARIVNSKAFIEKGLRETKRECANIDYDVEIAKAEQGLINAKNDHQRWNARSILQLLIIQKSKGYGIR